jgi:hypothetical protein
MNYQGIYNQIIERAQTRQLEGYKEKHHIIPKCLGGSNDKENLVELTAREHFLCHRLLCEIHPKESKLWYALWMMCNGSGDKKRYIPSSRIYENIKNIYSVIRKKYMTGKKHSDESKQKMRNAKLGIQQSEEHIKNRTGKLKGMKRNLEVRSKMSSSVPKLKPFLYKPVLQYDLEGNFIKEWESATTAALFLNKQNGNIVECLKGKKKKAYGYIWKYKEN